MFVGSTLGGLLPSLWGADAFSGSSLVFSAMGGALGIYAGFKLGQ